MTTQLSAPYVVIEKAAEITGYTRRAIEAKIERGVWLEGQVWFRAPDGRRLISIRGFEQWVEQGSKASMSGPRRSGSRSASTENSSDIP
jgi:hypothetical protein